MHLYTRALKQTPYHRKRHHQMSVNMFEIECICGREQWQTLSNCIHQMSSPFKTGISKMKRKIMLKRTISISNCALVMVLLLRDTTRYRRYILVYYNQKDYFN